MNTHEIPATSATSVPPLASCKPAAISHKPVMLNEMLAALAPRDDAVYVDCTFGAGGYTRALLAASSCRVWAVDRDPQAVALARDLAAGQGGRLQVLEGCFGDLAALLGGFGVERVDGIVFDLGVSSAHLDDPERGFSFRGDGPLDMRMGGDGDTAADLVNTLPEHELAQIIFDCGEERRARRVAAAIVMARAEAPILRTGRLASIVRAVVPASHDGIDPATRTFQALRMWVNDEPSELKRGLEAAERLLVPGGRLAVVSFHSLEDRVVKEFLRRRAEVPPSPSRHLPLSASTAPRLQQSFHLIERRPLVPTMSEVRHNPRSRSAKLRFAERTVADAFPTI
ncbi:MAG: 16S rRNA (cytosine(1402)-N(4))-methyltransferase RsmH [Rhodospirillaceae bacterium]